MKDTRVAIVGLGACYRPDEELAAFLRSACAGEERAAPAAAPAPADLLRAADAALADAGIGPETRLALVASGAGALPGRFASAGPALPAGHAAEAIAAALGILAEEAADAVLLLSSDGAGAGAVVFAPAGAAPGRAYALVAAFATDAEPVAAARAAFAAAGIPPERVGLLECASPEAAEGALRAYRSPRPDLTCALGSAAAHLGAPSPTASLIRAAGSLHRRTLPPFPAGAGAPPPCYAPAAARPWFAAPGAGGRVAAVATTTGTGAHAHMLLVEPEERRPEPSVRPHAGRDAVELIPIAAGGRAELLAALDALAERAVAGEPLAALGGAARAAYRERAGAPYALALVCREREELLREVGFAREGVARAFESGRPWSTPRGSAFTAQPLGAEGVAFVYPGAFNAYVGMGRDLFLHFPCLHERLAPLVSDLGGALAERLLYPRDGAATKAHAEALAADPVAMIESGSTMAVAYTALLRDLFGVRPHAALGYSLGEASMLWATGVWTGGDAGIDAWHASPLFETRLYGPQLAVREAWGLEPGGDAIWAVHLLKAPLGDVRAALEREPRVHVTLINLPDEVVVAGEPAGCRRVIDALGCHSLPVPFDAAIHHPAIASEYERFLPLYSHPVTPAAGVRLYSAAHYAPLKFEREALAQALAAMSCQTVDFPRLVEAAYAGGARIFVELGPQGTCTRWIERLLRGRPHAAVAVDRSGNGDYAGVLGALARLVSQRVPVDLTPLDEGEAALEPPAGTATAPLPTAFRDACYENLTRHAARVAEGHAAFLASRRAALEQSRALIGMQVAVAERMVGGEAPPRPARRRALFGPEAIRAFARGDPERCFPEYALFRGRRVPRLPNGDLLLVDRVVEIDGERGHPRPGAALVAEYDVAPDAWFYREGDDVPYAVIMEMALQPCGFLAAYAGSTLPHPHDDFYFRNLDGDGEMLAAPDVRGRTVTNRVQLISSTTIPGVILQKYRFEMACEGRTFYRGTSSFGYFLPESLVHQAGLGREAPWLPDGAGAPVRLARRGPLDLVDEVRSVADGGRHARGYAYAEARVSPEDWFFDCHFYQDPVMPGSLGVEAMRQALRVHAQATGLTAHMRAPRMVPLAPARTAWKYRGQITPQQAGFRLEVHVTDVAVEPGALTLLAEGNLWKEEVRIYEVRNLPLRLVEGCDS